MEKAIQDWKHFQYNRRLERNSMSEFMNIMMQRGGRIYMIKLLIEDEYVVISPMGPIREFLPIYMREEDMVGCNDRDTTKIVINCTSQERLTLEFGSEQSRENALKLFRKVMGYSNTRWFNWEDETPLINFPPSLILVLPN